LPTWGYYFTTYNPSSFLQLCFVGPNGQPNANQQSGIITFPGNVNLCLSGEFQFYEGVGYYKPYYRYSLLQGINAEEFVKEYKPHDKLRN